MPIVICAVTTAIMSVYILLFIEVALIVILFILSVNKFREEVYIIREEKGIINLIIPAGLMLIKITGHRFRSNYAQKLEAKFRDLYGANNSSTYLKIHMAKKSMLIIFAILFITFMATQINFDYSLACFSLILPGVLFYSADRQIDEKIKKRAISIRMEFPDFLNKFILLVNAGMTASGAIQRIAGNSARNTPFYTELAKAAKLINSGKPEIRAYEDFARRCKLQEVMLFTTTIIQNMRKGNDELIPVLRLQAAACWDNRKNAARKLGEEASTKLLLPMMLIFVAIIIMLMAPAVFQIQL